VGIRDAALRGPREAIVLPYVPLRTPYARSVAAGGALDASTGALDASYGA
jgi:hypothetical protein